MISRDMSRLIAARTSLMSRLQHLAMCLGSLSSGSQMTYVFSMQYLNTIFSVGVRLDRMCFCLRSIRCLSVVVAFTA
jgi:hypothetical protein